MGTASAPGKVILTGEHSVVYGYPALAGALNMRCTANVSDGSPGLVIHANDLDKTLEYTPNQLKEVLNGNSVHQGFDNLAGAVLSVLNIDQISYEIAIDSDVPIGAGLGSSAASAVSIVGALFHHLDMPLDKHLISQHAYNAEKIAHGTPSGIDNTVSAFGGLVWFQDGETKSLPLGESIPLVIANSNVPRDTKSLVSGVRYRKSRNEEVMSGILNEIGKVTQNIEEALIKKNYSQAGELFDINHGLLDAIGVGHPALSHLVHTARQHGAVGAKLTGAGGGGCIIALVGEDTMSRVSQALGSGDTDVYQTQISTTGVQFHD